MVAKNMNSEITRPEFKPWFCRLMVCDRGRILSFSVTQFPLLCGWNNNNPCLTGLCKHLSI